MKALALMLVPALASCGIASAGQSPRSERAETRLTRALGGKVAGTARKCIARFRSNDLEIVDRNTILFKNGRNLVYRNDPEGGCAGLDPSRTIVTSSVGSDLCRGDTIRVVDRLSRSTVGVCAFSDFIPYVGNGAASPGGS